MLIVDDMNWKIAMIQISFNTLCMRGDCNKSTSKDSLKGTILMIG